MVIFSAAAAAAVAVAAVAITDAITTVIAGVIMTAIPAAKAVRLSKGATVCSVAAPDGKISVSISATGTTVIMAVADAATGTTAITAAADSVIYWRPVYDKRAEGFSLSALSFYSEKNRRDNDDKGRLYKRGLAAYIFLPFAGRHPMRPYSFQLSYISVISA